MPSSDRSYGELGLILRRALPSESPSDRRLRAHSKKKTKPTDLLINGHSGSESNARQSAEHQGHKKSKSTHRPSQSISEKSKRSPSYGNNQKNGNPHGHPPSPATYPSRCSGRQRNTPLLLELHNPLQWMTMTSRLFRPTSFASLEVAKVMSLWLQDHGRLRQECGWQFKDVFQTLPENIDAVKKTPVVSHKKGVHHEHPDVVLHWQYLVAPHSIEKDTPLVELNGQLGFQKDYCIDKQNLWDDWSSPLPFVFFHPYLPLYIDTRREGSLARYVRRSCRPNAMLETYLAEGSTYHFWLVSDRQIAQDEQITIPWDFRLAKDERGRKTVELLGLGDEEMSELPDYDPSQAEHYDYLHGWLGEVLSNYGGCACDLGTDCAFVRFWQKYINRSHTKPGASKKKSRKPKPPAASPTSTGHATNSRAPSEGHGDDGGENDSGSARSKPPSRDMTPARQRIVRHSRNTKRTYR